MIQIQSYLEISDPGSGSHKFYEVTGEDNAVTVRFGRIGTTGQTQTHTYSSADEALRAANKKLGEKLDKGYEHAVPGTREKQEVPRRPRLTFEEQLANLASCGVSLSRGFLMKYYWTNGNLKTMSAIHTNYFWSRLEAILVKKIAASCHQTFGTLIQSA